MRHEIDSTKGNPLPSTPAYFAVIIVNPKSGSFSDNPHSMDETVAFLQEQGWKVELFYTKSDEEAKQLAKDAVTRKADLVVGVGSDGTIHCIIQELAGTETALGLLPSGTFNVWAKETGIPRDLVGARDVLVNGVTRRIDLGRLDNEANLLKYAHKNRSLSSSMVNQ